jgi:ParB/RepB/Spo0J family partition protein
MAANNAFADLSNLLGGVDALFSSTEQYSLVYLDQIVVRDQVRKFMEDEENTLADLAASIKAHGVIQPIVLRPVADGYELVAGERRYHASKMAGLDQIPAMIREMTDEEAEDAQLAENIQRKNLTQLEIAQRIQRDLDTLGGVEAVLAKHQKSRAWLSKILAMLDLPDQAKRLVTENVSADLEVINTVKTIEKHDPEKAKALVDDLKETRGQENARDKVAAVKAQVKPSKSQKAKQTAQEPDTGSKTENSDEKFFYCSDETNEGEIFAGAKNETPELPTDVCSENDNAGDSDTSSPEEILQRSYGNIVAGVNPQTVLATWSAEERDNVEKWLTTFFDSGVKASNLGRHVMEGFRDGRFGSNGAGAFALVAFIYGLEPMPRFDIIEVLSSVKFK